MMAVGNDNGPGRSALERETPEIALEPIEARDVLDGGIRIEGSTDCATVGKGPASLVEAKLLTDNSTGSVIWGDPLRVLSVDRTSFDVCVSVLRKLVKVSPLETTISTV